MCYALSRVFLKIFPRFLPLFSPEFDFFSFFATPLRKNTCENRSLYPFRRMRREPPSVPFRALLHFSALFCALLRFPALSRAFPRRPRDERPRAAQVADGAFVAVVARRGRRTTRGKEAEISRFRYAPLEMTEGGRALRYILYYMFRARMHGKTKNKYLDIHLNNN